MCPAVCGTTLEQFCICYPYMQTVILYIYFCVFTMIYHRQTCITQGYTNLCLGNPNIEKYHAQKLDKNTYLTGITQFS